MSNVEIVQYFNGEEQRVLRSARSFDNEEELSARLAAPAVAIGLIGCVS